MLSLNDHEFCKNSRTCVRRSREGVKRSEKASEQRRIRVRTAQETNQNSAGDTSEPGS